MKHLAAFFSKSVSRAAAWRALLYMAVAFAREITAAARARPHVALEKTEMLETFVWMASAKLSAEIAEEGAEADGKKPFDEQLAPIAVILHMFLIFILRMKFQLAERVAKRVPALAVEPRAAFPPAPVRLLPFIDTS